MKVWYEIYIVAGVNIHGFLNVRVCAVLDSELVLSVVPTTVLPLRGRKKVRRVRVRVRKKIC